MPGIKRAASRLEGRKRALELSRKAGAQIAVARKRRRLTQAALAQRVGISRSRLAEIEQGNGTGAPLEVWFALAEALGLYLRFEFGRDPRSELVDAGHLALQQLVIRNAKAAGWEVQFEAPSRSHDSGRSVDVRLVDRTNRRIVIVECWNTFGDLGAATRSSNWKVRDAEQQAVAIAGDGAPFDIGLVWVVRDTKANRELVARYSAIFDARLPGSSEGWARALTKRGSLPAQAGFVWSNLGATRLLARRRR